MYYGTWVMMSNGLANDGDQQCSPTSRALDSKIPVQFAQPHSSNN
jgi:hypothetical protein